MNEKEPLVHLVSVKAHTQGGFMKLMEVEVADIRKITGDGNTKAFADVRVGGSLLIKGVCVIKGKKGVFVSMPRKEIGRAHV